MPAAITPNIFFNELYSYMGYGGELNQGTPYIQGIGEAAMLDIPDMFDKFGSIKGLLYLKWEQTYDNSTQVFTGGKVRSVPLTVSDGVSRLYLPVTNMQIPVSVLESDLYPFRKGIDGKRVNLVVYKDTVVSTVTLAMLLRNNRLSPWVKYFMYILAQIPQNTTNLKLCVPRVDYDMGPGITNETFEVPVRLLNSKLLNVSMNSCGAILTLLPDFQDLELLTGLGL